MSSSRAAPLPESFRVAVVGAGISGLACASTLKARGAHVAVFEASRRPGGRAATEITPAGSFDHGAQFFTAQSSDFESWASAWCDERIVERWTAQVIALDGERTLDKTASAKRYIVRDGMQALGRKLGANLDVRLDTPVAAVTRRGASWQLTDGKGQNLSHGGYDAVVIAVPNAAELLAAAPELAQRAKAIVWEPCWAALLAIEPASGFEFGGAFVNDHPALGWVTREDSKLTPSAGGGERWVLHATARWSALHLNRTAEEVAAMLAEAFAKRFNFGFRPTFIAGRRWVTAAPANPLKDLYLWDASEKIGAVGDWCGGPRIEGAFLSGRALGQNVLA
ncbi:MAG: FAD-dependent oxidoreductase [Burkholderiaceae bacterium]